MIGQTTRLRRLIMAALRPLTGTRAAATARVKCSGAQDVALPANCFCYPVPASAAGITEVDDQRLIRTAADVVVPAGATGIAVPVTSVLGGLHHNALTAGTELLWDPPVPGLETLSVLEIDMAGGLDPPDEHPAAVVDVTSFEELTAGALAQDLFNARLSGRIPSVVVSWDRSEDHEFVGRGKALVNEVWTLFIVVETHEGEQARRDKGLRIMDAVRDLLLDKRAVDGAPFSDPPVRVLGRRRLATTESSLVYLVQIATSTTVQRLDLRTALPDGMVRDDDQQPIEDWLTTRYTMRTDEGATVVDGAIYDMPRGEFSREFSAEFKRLGT